MNGRREAIVFKFPWARAAPAFVYSVESWVLRDSICDPVGWTGFEKSAYPQALGLCPGGRFEWIRRVWAAGAFTPSLFPEPHPRPRLRNRLLFSLFSHQKTLSPFPAPPRRWRVGGP